ncbi:MAG: Wzz/FepE/Etk N-terminal domain-containing protein, partial [Desulfurivibrionaceae bacterium]|nr:Wzz/FepE/Etk N-terminal domain-containing protein [Desulfurivibrionaceae bacterium]
MDYWAVLVRRKKIVLFLFLAVFSAVALFTFRATPIFEASGTLHVRDEKGKVDLLGDLGLGQGSPIAAEIEIIKSRTNAEEVVRRLHLDWRIDKKSADLSFQVRDFTTLAPVPVYHIRLLDGERFEVKDDDGRQIGQGRAGEKSKMGGAFINQPSMTAHHHVKGLEDHAAGFGHIGHPDPHRQGTGILKHAVHPSGRAP